MDDTQTIEPLDNEDIQKLLPDMDDPAHFHLLMGITCCETPANMEIEDALYHLKCAVEMRGSIDDKLWLGIAYSKTNDFEHALPLLREAVTKRGQDADYRWLGMAYWHAGKMKLARHCFQKAVKRGEQTEDLHWLSHIYTKYGKHDKALSCIDRAIAQRGSPEDHFSKGVIHLVLADPLHAIEPLERAVKLRGDDNDYDALVEAYLDNGDYELAISNCRQLIEWRGNADDCLLLGKILSHAGQFEQAVEPCRRACDLRGDHGDYHFLGAIYISCDQYQNAIEILHKATELQNNPASYRELGVAYIKSDHPDKAIPPLQHAAELGGEASDFFWLGVAYENLKQPELAIEPLHKSLELHDRAIGYHWLGIACLKAGRIEGALQYLEAAVARKGDDIDYEWYEEALAEAGNKQALYNTVREKNRKKHENLATMAEGLRAADTTTENNRPTYSIFGLTVDLKLPEDGTIKVLECNMLAQSCLRDYTVTGDAIIQKINQDYNKLQNDYDNNGALAFRPDSDPGDPAFILNGCLNGAELRQDCALSLLSAEKNKGLFWHHIQEIGGQAYMPHTKLISRYEDCETAIATAMDAMDNCEHVVIKPCGGHAGKGVMVIEYDALPDAITAILHGHSPGNSATDDYWQNDHQPCFLVQECVNSKPVMAEDGHHYDAVMRVAATLVYDHHNQALAEFMPHGAWWKLPEKPVAHEENKLDRGHVVSQSSDNCAMDSAYADEADIKTATTQLKNLFTPLANKFAQSDSAYFKDMQTIIAASGQSSPAAAEAMEVISDNEIGLALSHAYPEKHEALITSMRKQAQNGNNSCQSAFARHALGLLPDAPKECAWPMLNLHLTRYKMP